MYVSPVVVMSGGVSGGVGVVVSEEPPASAGRLLNDVGATVDPSWTILTPVGLGGALVKVVMSVVCATVLL